jgi:hypothetical protein
MMVLARSLARRPAYSFLSIALLGLGIGAVSALFSLVDVALLRPLPYPAPDRLEALEAVEPEAAGAGAAYGLAAGDSRAVADATNARPLAEWGGRATSRQCGAGPRCHGGDRRRDSGAPGDARLPTRSDEALIFPTSRGRDSTERG